MPQKMSEVHLDSRTVGLQGAQIRILSNIDVRIAALWLNTGCEVFHLHKVVFRTEHAPEQRGKVEPFPWRAADRAIVEIETIHIDYGAMARRRHSTRPPKKQGPPKRPRAQQPKSLG